MIVMRTFAAQVDVAQASICRQPWGAAQAPPREPALTIAALIWLVRRSVAVIVRHKAGTNCCDDFGGQYSSPSDLKPYRQVTG
jgi:hypothetical protein